MNCSQLLERRANTNWEKAAPSLRVPIENRVPSETDSGRWNTVRFSTVGQTFTAWVAPTLKSSSN
jgi:hypothetical protein